MMRNRGRIGHPKRRGGIMPSFKIIQLPIQGGRIIPIGTGWHRYKIFHWLPFLVGRKLRFKVKWEPQSSIANSNPMSRGIYQHFTLLSDVNRRQARRLDRIDGMASIGNQEDIAEYETDNIANGGRCIIALGVLGYPLTEELISFNPVNDETLFLVFLAGFMTIGAAILGSAIVLTLGA